MFKKLKQRSFQKVIERNLKNRDFSQVNAPLKTLGFLVNEDAFKALEQLQNSDAFFGVQSKDLKVFSFVTMSKKAPSLRQDQVSNRDFSWNGSITNLNVKEFLDIPFDVLVGYYEDKNQYLDLMITESNAKFKVGVSSADPAIYDLLIDVKLKESEAFKKELKKYLQVLGKL